jgi:hypothetical protein
MLKFDVKLCHLFEIMKSFLCIVLFFSFQRVMANPVDSPAVVKELSGKTVYHSFYADLPGQGLYPSINYDFSVTGKKNFAKGFNAGIIVPSPLLPRNYGVNAAFHVQLGNENRSLELGLGSGFIYSIDKEKTFYQSVPSSGFGYDEYTTKAKLQKSHWYGFMTIGLRQYRPNDKIVIRLYAMPFFGIRNQVYPIKGLPVQSNYVRFFDKAAMFEPRLAFWGGFSIGYMLKPRRKLTKN